MLSSGSNGCDTKCEAWTCKDSVQCFMLKANLYVSLTVHEVAFYGVLQKPTYDVSLHAKLTQAHCSDSSHASTNRADGTGKPSTHEMKSNERHRGHACDPRQPNVACKGGGRGWPFGASAVCKQKVTVDVSINIGYCTFKVILVVVVVLSVCIAQKWATAQQCV